MFSLILDGSVSLSVGIRSAGIRFQSPWVRRLHSAEEDNWSAFDSISLPCCECIKIKTNKHVCMYICMHVCMHAYIHVGVHACMYLSVVVCSLLCKIIQLS